MELLINKYKLEEIANWINEKVDESTIMDVFNVDEGRVTEKEVKYYLISTLESNLMYDFGFEFGLD